MLEKKIHSETVDVFPRDGRFRYSSNSKKHRFYPCLAFHQQYTNYLSHGRVIKTIAPLYQQKLCQRWDLRKSIAFILLNVQYFWEKSTALESLSKVNYRLLAFYWYFISGLLKFKTRSLRNAITAILIKYYFENNLM